MSTRSFLVALGLLVLMLGALSFLQKQVPGSERMAKESRRITELPVREATRIDLQNAKGSFVFRREGEKDWNLEKPLPLHADPSAMKQLLMEIQFVETLQRFPPGKKDNSVYQTFGLGQPSRTLLLETKQGNLQMEVGRDTPIAGGVYVKIRQPGKPEEISVVQSNLATALDRDLTGWRDKRALPFVVAEVQEVRLHQGTVEVEVKKSQDGWTILKPVEAPADPSAVTKVLGELAALKVVEFVSDSGGDLALYGLNAPPLALEVWTGGTHRTLQIGLVHPKETNQVFARVADQPSVFLLSKAEVESLGKLAERVRDQRVARFSSVDQVQSMEFTGKQGEYRVERAKERERWNLVWGGSNRPADGRKVISWLQSLEEARANRFYTAEDPARLGLSKPRMTLQLKWNAPQGTNGVSLRTETLLFGDLTKEEIFVQAASTSGVMAVPATLWKECPEGPLGWLSTKVLPADLGEVCGFIWAQGGVRKEMKRGADGKWRLAGSEAETAGVANYLGELAEMEVMKWTGAPVAGDYTKNELELLLEGSGGKKARVRVGRAFADGSAPIRVEGAEFAGLISRPQLAQLKNDPSLSVSAGDSPASRR